jgi:hypothetical protein
VFGSIIPGFDDYTEDWGACQIRVMPRNKLLIEAATDYLLQANITHTLSITWDDWTEECGGRGGKGDFLFVCMISCR